MAALAADLNLIALRRVQFAVALIPKCDAEWKLNGHLKATVVQPCRVSLAPVTTHIDETVVRRYVADAHEVREIYEDADENTPPPADDRHATSAPFAGTLDTHAVMEESLTLAIPPFPRSANTAPLHVSACPPSASLERPESSPFAKLAALGTPKAESTGNTTE